MNDIRTGLTTFRRIRQEKQIYVDKTDLVYRLAHTQPYNFLSRPRRFGKSILVDTLDAYFSAEKELFTHLKIWDLEKEWRKYPVIRMDMSGVSDTAESLRGHFKTLFGQNEKRHGLTPYLEGNQCDRFTAIIRGAYAAASNTPVVVLVDEFDTPLYSTWNTPEHEACKSMYREAFSALKTCEDALQFVFITGICKFTQVSLFSVLNNLNNLSFDPAYATLCGFTWQEVEGYFHEQLAALAKRKALTAPELKAALVDMYDGYRFSLDAPEKVFNPYDITLALAPGGDIFNFWASSGATNMLNKFLKARNFDLGKFERCSINNTMLRTSDITGGDKLLLYQTGYLTQIEAKGNSTILGFPNREVREALYTTVVASFSALNQEEDMLDAFEALRQALRDCDIPAAEATLGALVADAPYSNKELACMFVEERYRFVMSTILRAAHMQVEVERQCAGGRIDLIARNSQYTYVFELKQRKYGGFKKAANQLIANGYTAPFEGDQRQVVALAIEVEDEGKRIIKWRTITPETPLYDLPPDTPRSPEEMEKDDD